MKSKPTINFVYFYAFLLQFESITAEYLEFDFTVAVLGGATECFHQLVKKNHEIEFGFNVIESNSNFQWLFPPSGTSRLKAGFQMLNEKNNIIYEDRPQNENHHSISVNKDEVYQMCLTNPNSYSTIMINIQMYIYNEHDFNDKWGYNDDDNFEEKDKGDEPFIDSLKKKMNNIHNRLIQITHEQSLHRSNEKKDLNLLLSLESFVNWLSILSVVIMFFVSISQVVLIRSFFDEKSQLHALFTPLFRRQ